MSSDLSFPPDDPQPAAPGADADAIDARLVRQLADILGDTGLTEIEIERGGLRIRVAKKAAALLAAPAVPAAPAPLAPAPAQAATAARSPAPAGDVVKSPMVGTAYLRPQPEAALFVRVGDQVSAGQTLLIVEAMKTMNPIPAPRGGVVTEVVVGDAQPVEFGQPLVVID